MTLKKIWIFKNGIFFTFAAIALAIILLLSLQVYKTYEMSEDIVVVGARVNTMNNFIKDVEQDLEKGLYIASFRAFASMQQFIADNGSFIADIDDNFQELVLDGTLDGREPGLMKDSTFTDWVDKIREQADKVGITANFAIIDVEINQTEPWSIIVDADINVTVEDKKGTSLWRRKRRIITKVGIENFEDPLYIINSHGRVTNPIVKAPTANFVVSGDMANLLSHINNSYYIQSNAAPNFLMRLQGLLSNSSAGIESLVNVQEFQNHGFGAKDRSAVDYIYFGTQSTVNYRINNTPPWFKLDSGHLSTYQVQNMTV